MIPVYLESPYAVETDRNIRFARACVLDCLARGESAFASHLYFTQALDDADEEQRRLGMEAGFAWAKHAHKTVVYTNLGISNGMREGIKRALEDGRHIEMRTLEGWDG